MKGERLNGEFWIEEVLHYKNLVPKISHRQGLVLYRMDESRSSSFDVINDMGPHFCSVFVNPYLFTTAHSIEEMREGPAYELHGTNLGGIWMNAGRESDSSMRHVTSINAKLSFFRSRVKFDLSGKAGPVIPGNEDRRFGNNAEPIVFGLWFEIPRNLVINVVETGEEGIKDLNGKLEKLGSA